jgi:hypothetical protein
MKTGSIIKHGSLFFFMQDGYTPAIAASQNGHTETLALLLTHKVDVNSADKVQPLKLFSSLNYSVACNSLELQDKDISVSYYQRF